MLVATLASLLLAELTLRLFWTGYQPKYDPKYPFGWFEFHPTRGMMLVPDLERINQEPDFRVVERHNSYGFRNPEIPLEKPADRLRVLIAGDSQTYGHGVENHEAYPRVLEEIEPSLQVINAGVPTYSGVEELILLREEIPRWKPDIVVVGYVWNDLYGAYGSAYAQFEVRDGVLVYIEPEPSTFDHPAFADMRRRQRKRAERYGGVGPRQTHLYRLVSDRIKILRARFREATRDESPSPADEAANQARRLEDERAWELSFALMREMGELSERHGARFLVLIVPDQVQVLPDAKVYGVPEYLWDVQSQIVRFAEEAGIPVLDPLPQMRQIYVEQGEPQFLPQNRHLDRVGHRNVAEMLRTDLRDRGWLGGSVPRASR